MNKETLRNEFLRLTINSGYSETQEIFQMHISMFFEIIAAKKFQLKSIKENDAQIILQMVFSKLLHIQSMTKGVSYDRISNLVDPTLINVVVRNMLETVTMFHLVYVHPQNKDAGAIIYNLWQLAGLNYRQRFNAESAETIAKSQKEKLLIIKLKEEIKSNPLWQKLSPKNQSIIQTKIKQKDYKVSIVGDKVSMLSWQGAADLFLTRSEIFKQQYNYYSMHAHPSYISVMQFSQLFNAKEEYNMIAAILKFVNMLSGVFMADLISQFPTLLEVFKERPAIERLMVDFPNTLVRGFDYTINNDFNLLD